MRCIELRRLQLAAARVALVKSANRWARTESTWPDRDRGYAELLARLTATAQPPR